MNCDYKKHKIRAEMLVLPSITAKVLASALNVHQRNCTVLTDPQQTVFKGSFRPF